MSEEKIDQAAIRLVAYQKRMARAYNKRVRLRLFDLGDLVMKKIQLQGERGNLDPKYEGPFKIVEKARVTAYYLEDAEGRKINGHGILSTLENTTPKLLGCFEDKLVDATVVFHLCIIYFKFFSKY